MAGRQADFWIKRSKPCATRDTHTPYDVAHAHPSVGDCCLPVYVSDTNILPSNEIGSWLDVSGTAGTSAGQGGPAVGRSIRGYEQGISVSPAGLPGRPHDSPARRVRRDRPCGQLASDPGQTTNRDADDYRQGGRSAARGPFSGLGGLACGVKNLQSVSSAGACVFHARNPTRLPIRDAALFKAQGSLQRGIDPAATAQRLPPAAGGERSAA